MEGEWAGQASSPAKRARRLCGKGKPGGAVVERAGSGGSAQHAGASSAAVLAPTGTAVACGWRCGAGLPAEVEELHTNACVHNTLQYTDPATGYMVFTSRHLLQRGSCCGLRCRHCPYGHFRVPSAPGASPGAGAALGQARAQGRANVISRPVLLAEGVRHGRRPAALVVWTGWALASQAWNAIGNAFGEDWALLACVSADTRSLWTPPGHYAGGAVGAAPAPSGGGSGSADSSSGGDAGGACSLDKLMDACRQLRARLALVPMRPPQAGGVSAAPGWHQLSVADTASLLQSAAELLPAGVRCIALPGPPTGALAASATGEAGGAVRGAAVHPCMVDPQSADSHCMDSHTQDLHSMGSHALDSYSRALQAQDSCTQDSHPQGPHFRDSHSSSSRAADSTGCTAAWSASLMRMQGLDRRCGAGVGSSSSSACGCGNGSGANNGSSDSSGSNSAGGGGSGGCGGRKDGQADFAACSNCCQGCTNKACPPRFGPRGGAGAGASPGTVACHGAGFGASTNSCGARSWRDMLAAACGLVQLPLFHLAL